MKSVAAILFAVALFAAPASAQDIPQPIPMQGVTIVQSPSDVSYPAYSAPTVRSYPYNGGNQYNAPQQQNFFGRLLELERRKNAWLRRTFLGL